jgi:hypothetical protein
MGKMVSTCCNQCCRAGVARSRINSAPGPIMVLLTTRVAEPHHFYAALPPIKNFDAAQDPAALAPAPTLLYR